MVFGPSVFHSKSLNMEVLRRSRHVVFHSFHFFYSKFSNMVFYWTSYLCCFSWILVKTTIYQCSFNSPQNAFPEKTKAFSFFWRNGELQGFSLLSFNYILGDYWMDCSHQIFKLNPDERGRIWMTVFYTFGLKERMCFENRPLHFF